MPLGCVPARIRRTVISLATAFAFTSTVACGTLGTPSGDRSAANVPVYDAGDPGPDAGMETDGMSAVEAESGGCALQAFNPKLVCFGSSPDPYQTYLSLDAGAALGQCPAPSDFRKSTGEGSCAYSVCGPLVPGAGVDLADAGSGLAGQQATGSCCFWVLSACGV